jgi:integrase
LSPPDAATLGERTMPIEKLNASFVRDCTAAGLYGDGKGLWLRVGKTPDQKSWVYRFMVSGTAFEMGLGSVLEVPLKTARKKAQAARELKGAGINPLQHRREQKEKTRGVISFREAAEQYIEAHAPSWKSAVHLHQWRSSLATYVYPSIGKMPVNTITTTHVLRTLEPVWTTRTETGKRLRSRIELVLSWCTARGYCEVDAPNAARWKANLDALLPAPAKVAAKGNYAALPYADVPALVAKIAASDTVASRALEFLILCASRRAEVVGAEWKEIDLAARVWTIPGARMKGGVAHRVPLSDRAVALLGTPGTAGRVFPIHYDVLRRLIAKLAPGATLHGFRASFSTWAAEQTDAPPEAVEACLAHITGSQVSRAYQRSDLLDKRRDILTHWAAFCTRKCK